MSHPRAYEKAMSIKWDGNQLRLSSGRLLATLEPDQEWPGLWRVRLPDGTLTDMVNRSRARDAARSLVTLNLRQAA